MSTETEQIEELFLSSEFGMLSAYSKEFNLFETMGIRSKETIHSNILAALLNPDASHGIGHTFIDLFLLAIKSSHNSSGIPLTFSDTLSATGTNVRVFRELECIDIVIEFPDAKLVVGIENKIWSDEQTDQIMRYQNTLRSRYKNFKKAIVFLTPSGKEPITADKNIDDVPVYCMPYSKISEICRTSKNNADALANSLF